MKTKVAMAISIAGVLVAGTAAALVNTQVLDSSASPTSVSIDGAPQGQQTDPTVTSAVTATAASVVDTTLPQSTSLASQAVYSIGNAGTVTLDTAGDVLTIVAVTPANGWVVTKSETDESKNAEIKMRDGNAEIEFHANLLFGVVTTSFESKNDSETSNSVDDHGGSGSGSDDQRGGEDD